MARFRFFHAVMLGFLALALSGCAQANLASHFGKKLPWPGSEESAGTYKVGKPYRVGSVWYYPEESFDLVETGIASWYGPDFHGKHTANGEVYDQNELTAAHRTLQMPSMVRVTNLENGRSVVARVNDRGPFKHGRVIDMSKRGAELLGYIGKGTARVRVEVLKPESQKLAAAAKRGADVTRMTVDDVAQQQPVERFPAPVSVVAARNPKSAAPKIHMEPKPQQVAYLKNDAEALPESLLTPTITVEELTTSVPSGSVPSRSSKAIPKVVPPPLPKTVTSYDRKPIGAIFDQISGVEKKDFAGYKHDDGRVMPNPEYSQGMAVRTGIFVQAGSFAVYGNAERMRADFSGLATVNIDEVQVKGRRLYRVKLGPIASVEEADKVLSRVVDAGHSTAKVVRN